jgi:hypothetical protein
VQPTLQFARPGGAVEEPEQQGSGSALPEYTSRLQQYIRMRWEMMRNHRISSGLEARMLDALRVFRGEYSATQLAAIQSEMGGSVVYARIVGTKARAATAILRDLYMGTSRPWEFSPTDRPTLPDDIEQIVQQVLQAEVQQLVAQGMPVDPAALASRTKELKQMLQDGQKEQARVEAERATDEVNDILQEGGFYQALSDILSDITYMPYVVLKGPAVRMADVLRYEGGVPQRQRVPKLYWVRTSPFDFYWTPGVANVADAETCERLRWTRRDLNDLIGLPGWDEEAVRAAIDDYDHGLVDWMDGSDSERASREGREDPNNNQSGMIAALEFHGYARGEYLRELGFDETEAPDEDFDYAITAWVCGRHVLKVAIKPMSKHRHPYFITSMEKIPGTPVGMSLPDFLVDIEQTACVALRSLSNNMALASGPQVRVDIARLAEGTDPTVLHPWKIWLTEASLFSGAGRDLPPVEFFQPASNAQQLLQVYQQMTVIADELSAIPRYVTGGGATAGAGRTASGLNQLMQNALKVLQQVAYNIDTDLVFDSLQALYEMLMVTDAGVNLRGDEHIVVKGVTQVISREVERVRQLEFLSMTGNPIDLQITGLSGRAEVLRAVGEGLNLPVDRVVPSRDAILQQEKTMAAQGQNGVEPGEAPTDNPVGNTVQPNFNKRGA